MTVATSTNQSTVILRPAMTSVNVRLLLWHQLGDAAPTMQETFDIGGNGVGEEVIRMPPFAPLNSFVHVAVSTPALTDILGVLLHAVKAR